MTMPRVLTAFVLGALSLSFGGLVALLATAQAIADDIDHEPVRERSLGVLEDQFRAFRAAGEGLADASKSYCAGDMAQAAYLDVFRTAWLAWAPLEADQFGPIEQHAAALSVAFWPDKKDYVRRGLEALLALPAGNLADPATIASGSAAAKGFPRSNG